MLRNHMSLQVRLLRRTVIALIAPMSDMLMHRLLMVPERFGMLVLALAVLAGEEAVLFGLVEAGGEDVSGCVDGLVCFGFEEGVGGIFRVGWGLEGEGELTSAAFLG
jgi:hypothetical protein